MSPFEIEVLGWLLDDYEAPNTLAQDISRELARPVSEADILSALVTLAKAGLAQPFVYDESSQQFRTIDPSQMQSKAAVWFMATPTGRAAVESYWLTHHSSGTG